MDKTESSCARNLIKKSDRISEKPPQFWRFFLLRRLLRCVRPLKVKLINGLGCHELHGWALHRLGDRLRIAEVVLLSLRVGADVLRRHQPGIVTKRLKLPAEMMRTNTSLHANQARWHVGQSCFDLATRPFLTQNDRTPAI
jgi:hypothetical protein